MIHGLTQLTYLAAAALFILSLRWLSHPKTARRGVAAGVGGMSLAILGTLLAPEIVNYSWIAIAALVGIVIGVPLSWVPLTAVPQRTALSHAFGGLAAGLVGTAKYMIWFQHGELTRFRTGAIALEIILGYLTFTGSLMAAGKLQEIVPTRPITYPNQNFINLGLLAIAIGAGVYLTINPYLPWAFALIIVLSLVFGVLLILPIGGADMPTVISLLNCVRGIVGRRHGLRAREQAAHHGGRARRIVGADPVDHHVPGDEPVVHQRPVRRVRPGAGRHCRRRGQDRQERDAAGCRRAPDQRRSRGRRSRLRHGGRAGAAPGPRALRPARPSAASTCKFAIHPVAGRMPGHMNVLLAEAEIPYDALVEMDDINPELPQTDVALVVGANDVVNPAARHDKNSPIFGMPIIDVDKAKTVIAIKRSMSPGFAGIDNELYYLDHTLMAFGDAKQVLGDVVKAVSGEGGGH